MSAWFDTALGQAVLEREGERLSQCTRRFHGDTLLWLAPVNAGRLAVDLDRCMVRHRVFGCALEAESVGSDRGDTSNIDATQSSHYFGQIDALPFRTSFMDAVVVQHGLDLAQDSRAAIREVARVVTPGGWLLICGFNPYSIFGMRRLAAPFKRGPFSAAKFVSPMRLLDWLAVLDFEVEGSVDYFMYRLPLDRNKPSQQRGQQLRSLLEKWRVPFGGVYVVMARKRAVQLGTPDNVKPLKARFNLIPMPNPTRRRLP